ATRRGLPGAAAGRGDPSEAARDADSLTLLRYGLEHYHRLAATVKGRRYASAKLSHRDARVAFVATRTVRRTVRRGDHYTLRILDAPRQVDAPLPAGARVGTIEVRWRGKAIDRVALVTRNAVAGATVVQRAGRPLGRTLSVLAVAVVLLGSLQVVLLRRRLQRRRRGRTGGTEIA